MSEQQDSPIVVTLKGGKEFDAPWIVVRGDNPDGVVALLDAISQRGLIAKTVELAGEFAGVRNAAVGLNATPTQVQVPQGAPVAGPTTPAPQVSAPQGQAAPGPVCQHGPRQYKEGVSKAGKPYKLWACTGPRGQECPPEWIR